MAFLDISLIFAILLCSLVAGFIFTYSIVVMPGLSNLNDKDFLKAFQVTDAVIQNNQPLFMFTWIGSIVAILTTIVASFITVGLLESWLIILVGAAYLLGVQGITVAIHIPLNNHIQKLNIDELNDKTLAYERKNFEAKWNFFNKIRTFVGISASSLLLLVLSLQ